MPWKDDGRLRIVAYIGRRLLKRGDGNCNSLTVNYEGEALDIDCACNINCGRVSGNIKAGGNVHCGDVDGSVTSPGGVRISK